MSTYKSLKEYSKGTILYIEDEEALSDIYSTKLSMDGYDVITADDGVEGLKCAIENKPDLILLDIILPKKDGLGVLTDIKNNNDIKSIPVILLSNLGQDYEVKEGMKLGAYKFLTKANYTPAQIVTEINNIFDKKK